MTHLKQSRGPVGEAIACRWLESQGYVPVGTNFSRRIGEIDLIMLAPDGLTIVFVEVRYRSNHGFGGALASVNYRKQLKLVRTANSWLQQYGSSMTPARIDVIAISPVVVNPDAALNQPSAFDPNIVAIWEDHELTWIMSAVEAC